MTLSKKKSIDSIETCKVQNHYVLQIREIIKVIENNNVISQIFHRYVLNPNHDISKISDSTVLNQFNAVMTSKVKNNYQEFLLAKEAEEKKYKENED
tara:strand:+ start:252 stop:542 length:291 start_codon:yes stop_codon:yes gene_type:complete